MRDRIEDLGRLQVLLSKAVHCPIFDFDGITMPTRPKRTEEWMEGISEHSLIEKLQTLFYEIENLKEEIWDMLEIAEARDSLNLDPEINK